MILDDSDDVLGESSVDAWREWLLWSTLLQLRTRAAVISSRRQLATASMMMGTDDERLTGVVLSADLDAAWQGVFDEASVAAKSAILALAQAGVAIPVVGEEVDGVPVEISLPSRRVA